MLVRLLIAAVVAAVGSPRGVSVHIERVAGDRVDFAVEFPQGAPDRFVGYASGNRPTSLTACFLREFYGKLCRPAPRRAGNEGIPAWVLPARFAHPALPGLIWPGPLAVAPDGSLLIVDTVRRELFRRTRDGTLHLVMPTASETIAVGSDGSIYLADGRRVQVRASNGAIRLLPERFNQVRAVAFSDGHLDVEEATDIVELNDGKATTVVRTRGFFSPDLFAVAGGDFYVYSGGTKTIEELTRSGKMLHRWQAYADALATAPDGSVLIGSHFAALVRIHGGKIATVVAFPNRPAIDFPFQPDGVAVAGDGTTFVDTDVGNGYTNQTALAAVSPDGNARLLHTTTPLAATLPSGMTTGCPSPAGLRTFDTSAKKAAIHAAQVVDIPPFDRGLQLSDPSWWSGFYTDQIDGRYEGGRHHVYFVYPASSDPYSAALVRRCGAALVDRSLAVVVGRGVYSDQVSHMFFLDRGGRALLYWQHT